MSDVTRYWVPELWLSTEAQQEENVTPIRNATRIVDVVLASDYALLEQQVAGAHGVIEGLNDERKRDMAHLDQVLIRAEHAEARVKELEQESIKCMERTAHTVKASWEDHCRELEAKLAAAEADLVTARNTCEMLRVSNNRKHDRLTQLESRTTLAEPSGEEQP